MTTPTTIMGAGEQKQITVHQEDGAPRRAGSYALTYSYFNANDVRFQVVSPHLEAAAAVRVADSAETETDDDGTRDFQLPSYQHVLALRWEGQTFICVAGPGGDSPGTTDANGDLEDAPGMLTRVATTRNPVVAIAVTADASGNLTIRWQESDGLLETATFPGAPMPASTPVGVTTEPPGLGVSVDGIRYTTPHTFQWAPGTIHSVAAGTPQPGAGGLYYIWNKWSDELHSSHEIYAPAAATTYRAYFDPAEALTLAVSPANAGTVRAAGMIGSPGSSVQLFPPASEVYLWATPSPGYSFSRWTGPVSDPATAQTTVAMNGPQTVTALFKANLPIAADPVLRLTRIIPMTVMVSTLTPGASIRYTIDGSAPTANSGTLYTGPVIIENTATLKAIAYARGMEDSKIATLTILLTGLPSFSPAAGPYPTAQSVTLSTSTTGPGVWIRYTLDGTTPTTNAGTLYTGPISVKRTTTIRASAFGISAPPSGVSSATYTIGK